MVRNSTLRNVAVAVVVLVAVHLFYTVTYPRVVSYSAGKYWSQNEDSPFDPAKLAAHVPPTSEGDDAAYAESIANATERPRAALVVLARNSDLEPMRASMREMEDRFNRRFRYDWVFLNDEPFTEHFKLYTSSLTKATTKYGLIPKEHWSYPPWIDQEKATAERERMRDAKVIYGGSLSYRHMCRFNSGFFFRHELLAEYEYYWRVEPGVKFYCDVLEDPFVTLKKSGKMYGFTITLYEYVNTIPTLWEATKEFIRDHPEHIAEDNSLGFISHDRGMTYNLCHFWSNFEIAALDFWRSKAYMDYFEHLDRKGGFFYERWGDAPVHSIAAALLLKKGQVHFFNDIGYFHNPFHHCPPDPQSQLRCVCDVKNNFDDIPYSCLGKWKKVAGVP